MMLGQLVMMGQRAKASAERIFEILDESPEVVERPGAFDLTEATGRIEFRHVSFAYGDGPAILSDFDLAVEPGETVAIVGRTGSGKSTVARLLTRFYDVSDGAVAIDDHDVRDVTLSSLRARVGVVTDEPFLFSISIRDNIAYGRPDATRRRGRGRRARGERPRVHRRPPRGLRHRRRRARLHAVGRPAPAHRHRAHPAGQPAHPGARRLDQRHRRPRRGRDLRGAARPARLAHDAGDRAPHLDDRARRPGRAARRAGAWWPPAPTRACWPPPRSTPRSSPRPPGSPTDVLGRRVRWRDVGGGRPTRRGPARPALRRHPQRAHGRRHPDPRHRAGARSLGDRLHPASERARASPPHPLAARLDLPAPARRRVPPGDRHQPGPAGRAQDHRVRDQPRNGAGPPQPRRHRRLRRPVPGAGVRQRRAPALGGST